MLRPSNIIRAFFVVLFASLATMTSADEFMLESVNGTRYAISVNKQQLVLRRAMNHRAVYDRATELDTPTYFAYFNGRHGQYIRFPRRGSGPVYYAAQAAEPVWKESSKRLIRANANAAGPATPEMSTPYAPGVNTPYAPGMNTPFSPGARVPYVPATGGGPVAGVPVVSLGARTEFLPNPPLQDALVTFENRHQRDLLIRIHDTRYPEQEAQEFRLGPNQSVQKLFQRDAGGVSSQVYRRPRLDGTIGEFRRERLVEPQSFYVIDVWSRQPQYQYKSLPGRNDSFTTYSEKSLGRFTLPAGKALPNGAIVDVYGKAMAQNNPGAVAQRNPSRYARWP